MATKTVPVEMETVDLTTGDTIKSTVNFHIAPPHPDACQICGRRPAHEPDQPHDALSLYYQYAFYGEHARWPTWKDAIAHCPLDVQRQWEAALRQRGAWTE